MIDIDNAVLPRSVRPLPRRIPPGSHILSHADLRAIAKHFVGRDDPVLGEELIPHLIHHSMFGADSGRVIPPATLAEPELGEGDPIAGRKVLRKFLDNIRKRPRQLGHEGDEGLDLSPGVFQQAHQVGPQLGSNPGGTFTNFPDGIDRYIKAPRTERQAREEVLAGKLYEALGVPVARTELTRLPSGELAVASRIVPNTRPLKGERPGSIPELREHFPADAWLANWDVVGGRKDNILLDSNHSAWRIDQGGSLNYRPKGRLKGREFGNTVGETTSLLNPKYRSGEVFAGVEPDPNNATAQRIASLPDHTIRSLVHHYIGEHDAYGVRGLADKLIARRHDLARQYGLYA